MQRLVLIVKKQTLIALFLLAAISIPTAIARDWYEDKYDRDHHWSWDEWKASRLAWENEHAAERKWDEKEMKREWEKHKHHYHY
jgi:hypothetical protein